MIIISFLTAPAHRPIERQTTIRLVVGNSSVIRAQSYQIPIEILLNFHHFIENLNTQSLLHKMNDDKVKLAVQLMHAIEENDTATASSLISSGIVNLNRKPLLLHRAAQLGRVEIMSVLLDAGADINAVDRFQQSACHFAIFENHFDALKLLVERGANLGVVDSNGNSLLSTVARRDRDERFAILLLDAGAPLDGLPNDELMGLVSSVIPSSCFTRTCTTTPPSTSLNLSPFVTGSTTTTLLTTTSTLTLATTTLSNVTNVTNVTIETASSVSSVDAKSSSSGSASVGALIGGIIGGILVLLLIVALIVAVIVRRRRNKSDQNNIQLQTKPQTAPQPRYDVVPSEYGAVNMNMNTPNTDDHYDALPVSHYSSTTGARKAEYDIGEMSI
jgi:hypothetical protein